MSDSVNKESLNSSLNIELGVLREIYTNELVIESEDIKTNADIDESGDHSIKDDYVKKFHVNLLPSTADEKAEQFVALTISFQIPAKYPDEVPEISLKSPRGLSDEDFNKIQKGLNEMAEKKKGTSMLYELFDFAKESLTAYNFPSGKCMICLYEFTKDDVFTKTNCFHHFHCRCLADYSKSHESSKESNESEQKKEATDESGLVPCPVCRVDFTLNELLKEPFDKYPLPALSKKPIAEEKDIVEEARQNQEKFADIYEKQQQKGGIINLEKENEVLHISNSAIANESAKQNTIDEKTQTNNESKDTSETVQINSESSHNKPDVPSTLPKEDEQNAVETDKSKEKTENATSSSSVEATLTTKDKENIKPKPKRRSRRNNRRNRTKSREASHNEQTSNEAQAQSSEEQQTRPQENEHRDRNQHYHSNNRNYRNYNYNNNYRNYNQRNSRNNGSPNTRDYGMNQENGYKANGYNNYWNRSGYKDRPGYYAPRVFRYSRPRPEMHYETSNDSNNINSQTNRRVNKGTEHQRNAVQNGEGSRHYNRRYSDDAYYNVQSNQQQPRNRYNNYYRQQNYDYNQRSNYDYPQNRFYYPPENPRFYSSRNSYYNGPNRRYQQVRRTSESGGGRRRNNTVQSQASSKAIETKPSTSVVDESTVILNHAVEAIV